MGKLKEYYHDEINRGVEQVPEDYGITAMQTVSHAVKLYRNGEIDENVFIMKIFCEVNDFDKLHEPCRPQ